VQALLSLPDPPEVIAGTFHDEPNRQDTRSVRQVTLDITDFNQVCDVVKAERPTHLFHLAGIAVVHPGGASIRQMWDVNFVGTLNVALAILDTAPKCRLLCCTSAEVYGASLQSGQPADEKTAFDPVSSYGGSKAAADLMIGQMTRQGLRAIRLRPFNHTGPGQSVQFVVPGFAAQIARIERGEREPVIQVGNLASRRDFLDVRDVVDAYVRAILRFDQLPSNCAMNLASGRPVAVEEILRMLLSMSPAKIDIVQDDLRMRTSDVSVTVGDASLARKLLNWGPRIALDATLSAVLESFRSG
jgi:GDP-4-dehydro-6-deoxy-D-mannose reductase